MADKPSPDLSSQISILFEASNNKDRLLTPSEARESLFFKMLNDLRIIVAASTKDINKANELFLQYYSVCLRGTNPFKDSQLKKAGVDVKEWKRILTVISGDFSK